MKKNKKKDHHKNRRKMGQRGMPGPLQSTKSPSGKPFPHFRLASMEGVDPAAIDATSPLGRLILVLAVAFNDLKGIIVFSRFLRGEARLETGEMLSSRGQYIGLAMQMARFMAGVVHELMVELKEELKTIESEAFRKILEALTPQASKSWQAMLAVARGDNPSSKADSYSHMLLLVRNSVAFHYSGKALGRGYREHFDDTSRPHSTRAVFSDGTSMEDTRFFFADAATEQTLASVTGLTRELVLHRTAELAGTINLALKPIVVAYLRSAAAKPYPDVHVPPSAPETPLNAAQRRPNSSHPTG